MNAFMRAARFADPQYLLDQWREANGNWMTPSPQDIRAFLERLAKDVPEEDR